METKDIHELIDAFHQEADHLSNALGIVNGRLREGRAPTKLQVERLTEGLGVIRERYQAVYKVAQALSREELKQDCTVDEYLKAAAIGIQTQKLEELLKLRSVVDEFLSIRSNKEKYEQLLWPLRQQAYDLADAMEKPRLEDVNALLEQVQGPKYFVEAVREPPGSPRLGELIEEELNERYSAEVLLGFLTNAYKLGETPVARAELPKQQPAPKKQKQSAPQKTEKARPKQEPAEKKPAPKKPAEPPKPAEAPPVVWAAAAQAESLAAVEAQNRLKAGPPNGSSFRSKLLKIDPDMVAVPLMQLLDVFGAVTPEQMLALAGIERMLYDPDETTEATIAQTLDALADRGWVAKYEIEVDGSEVTLYGITSFAAGSMRKETVQKAFRNEWPLAFSDSPRTFERKENLARLINEYGQKEALLDYLDGRVREIGFDIYRQVVSSVTWDKDHYQLLVYSRGQERPQRYHLVTPAAPSKVPAGEPVIIVGNPLKYERELVDGWQAPVLYLDPWSDDLQLHDAREAFLHAPAKAETAAAAVPRTHVELAEPEVLFDSTILSDAAVVDDSRLLPVVQCSLDRPTDGSAAEIKDAVVETVVLAKAGALAKDVREGKQFSRQLQLGTNIVLDELDYTGTVLAEIFPEGEANPEACLFGAYAFALLAPGLAEDYVLRSRGHALLANFEQYFPSLGELRPLFSTLVEVADKTGTGFSPAVMDRLGGKVSGEQYLRRLMADASNYTQAISPNVNLKALAPIYKKVFGLGSAFEKCMKIIARDSREGRDEVARELDIYCRRNAQGVRTIDPERIDMVLDDYWDTYCRNKNNRRLSYHARGQLIRSMRVRLDLMLHWLEYVDDTDRSSGEQKELQKLRQRLKDALEDANRQEVWKGHAHANLLAWILTRLRQRVESPVDDRRLFNVFLLTGHVMLGEDGRPLLDDRFARIRHYAPWTLVARHIEEHSGPAHDATFSTVRESIEGTDDFDEDDLLDNLQQLEMIGLLTDEPASECTVTQEQVEEAIDFADTYFVSFEEKLELYQMLGQVTEEEKAALREEALANRDFFYGIRNLASWREFLDALAWEGAGHAQKHTELLLDQVEARREKGGDSELLDDAEMYLERDVPNITLAEEALNNYDMGLEPETLAYSRLFEKDWFSEFCLDMVYRTFYEECRRQGTGPSARPLRRFGASFFEKRHPSDWSQADIASTMQMLQNWPASKGAPTTKHIVAVLQGLGFDVSGAKRTKMTGNAELYQVDAVPTPANGGPYVHPIAAFGTELPRKLDVIAIYGPCSGEELFATLAELDTETMPIVLLDYQLDQGQRRVIAELFRTHSDQKAFLLVDRVLALYLSMAPPPVRQSVLLQCTLPYAGLQPFGKAELPDEMFSGRTDETAALLDPAGPAVLYGGRQTGKTALLRHAQCTGNLPAAGRFVVYVDAAGIRDEAGLSSAVREAANAVLPETLPPAADLKALAASLGGLLDASDKIGHLTVLIDNADGLLARMAEEGYEALRALTALRTRRSEEVKFVLAGTVETSRAYHHEAGILRELGTDICLGQLRQSEAEEMLLLSLEYLGFRQGHHGEVQTMIANTNYYPSVIRELGCTLVNTLAAHSNKYYLASAGHPPYPLRSTELGAVMRTPQLHESIRDAVQLSLDLDPRYEPVARCIAWLCLSDGSSVRRSYSVKDIASVAHAYETPALQEETEADFRVLLDEMVDMGLLLRDAEEHYRLRRDSFLDIVGRDQTLLEKQLSAAEEVPV